MIVTFNTQNEQEVAEVLALLGGQSNTVEAEEPKKKKTTPAKAEDKKPVEEPKKTSTKIALADLKEAAKNAVTRSSREDVKKTIGEFAEKLAEVDEADYGKLYKKLQALGV